MSDDESIESDGAESVESIDLVEILSIDTEDGYIGYLCRNADLTCDVYDRSDLMDDGRHQRMVLAFERQHPIPWDPICPVCEGEGCEECECPECDATCRFFQGINYGCPLHPVV